MSSNTTDLFDTIEYIIYLCCDILVSVSWQLVLLSFRFVSWCLIFCFYSVIALLGWASSVVSISLRLIETIATKASQMKLFSNGLLWPSVYACTIMAVIGVAAWLTMIGVSKTNTYDPTKSTTYSKYDVASVPQPARSKTYTKSYINPIKDPPCSFNEPLRPYKTWDGSESSLAHNVPPPATTRPTYRTSQSSSSYFFRSFDPDEYNGFLQALDDERLRRESETILSNLGANLGGAAVHWGHAAATGGLTAPLSIAGTVVSGRKGYVNKRKLKLVENELNSRMLRAKFGARGLARIAGNSILTGATMGMHSGS